MPDELAIVAPSTAAPDEDYLMAAARAMADKDERFTSTLFSFYSVDARATPALKIAIPALQIETRSWHPTGAIVANMGKRETLKTEQYLTSAPPTLGMSADQRKMTLPAGDYLILYSPCIKQGDYVDHFLPKRAITIILGLLAIAIGKNAFLDHLTDQILIPATSQESYISKAFRVPQAEDFVYFRDPAILNELMLKLASVSDDLKGQIRYILEMFGRAVQERDPAFQFSLYWISLELISQTKGDGVAAKLGNAYGQNKTYVYDTLEFRQIYNARHNFFHKGLLPLLTARQERLMQCYFMDLVRARLHLPCKQLSLTALSAF